MCCQSCHSRRGSGAKIDSPGHLKAMLSSQIVVNNSEAPFLGHFHASMNGTRISGSFAGTARS